MLRQILVGAVVSVCNIAVHALVMTAVVRVAHAVHAKDTFPPSLRLIGVMTGSVSVLMAAHAVEVLIWALAYALAGATAPGANVVYFAFVNYTTLGYGDVLPVQEWLLIGPITAMNGMLLFGWSAAVIFEVLRKAMIQGPGGAAC